MEAKIKKLCPETVAPLLGISPQAVRARMRNGSLPIGVPVKHRTRYEYPISAELLYKHPGIKVNGYEPPVINTEVNIDDIISKIEKLLKTYLGERDEPCANSKGGGVIE